MEFVYLGIVIFLFALSIFDLSVGVSNDAVNFLSSAIGSKAARFKLILAVAAIGIFVGATTSNGMMDIARHGIFRPECFTFEQLMCIFLAVVASDVILLDMFNMLGMPTSTTVSMVFELLGGSTALAFVKMMHDHSLTYAQLINTDKALSVIMAIFISVAIAFIFGLIVQWIARCIFTFHYTKHLKYTIAIFGGLSFTSISYFLIVKGFGTASFMTPEIKSWIASNTSSILIAFLIGFTILTQILHLLKVNIFKITVLFGTFSLAMAFAGNDLVNFIGVTLAGFSSYQDFMMHPGADPSTYLMGSLNDEAKTPLIFLVMAGIIMIAALTFSKKAHNVIKTSVDLSRQTAGDEMFGSSRFARRLVRGVMNTTEYVIAHVPENVKTWINSRFNQDETILEKGAAFDLVRASINLVLSGLLIVVGTSLKLPLSTTYVAFMVGMGSSLADRAWGRESAVFRVTGVISVIGGWFMTAGAAFFLCFIVTMIVYYGGIVAMILLMVTVVFILWNNSRSYKKKMSSVKKDELFTEIIDTQDPQVVWPLLSKHFMNTQTEVVRFVADTYVLITEGLLEEDVKKLRKVFNDLDSEKKHWKVQRRKEIIGLRKIDPLLAVEKNTWFYLACNSCEQSFYCLKRMCEPIFEHVDNNFNPLYEEYEKEYAPIKNDIICFIRDIAQMIESNEYSKAIELREKGNEMKATLSILRKQQQQRIAQSTTTSLKVDFLYLSMLQESQELIGHFRHLVRACRKFQH